MSRNKYQIIDQIAKLQSTLNESLTGKHILIRCVTNEHRFTVFSRYAQKRLAPASTTKFFLLHFLLQQPIDLESFIQVQDSDITKGSGNNLKVGHHYRIKDLMINLMTASSNTAAKILARYLEQYIGQNYVEYANQYHASLGLKDTNLTNEHGLANRHQYVTLSDFSIMLEQKVDDDNFLDFMNIASYRFHSLEGDEVVIENTYKDIELEECIGVKTGTLVPGVFNIIVFFNIAGLKGYIIDFYNENKEDRNQDIIKVLQTLKAYNEDLV